MICISKHLSGNSRNKKTSHLVKNERPMSVNTLSEEGVDISFPCPGAHAPSQNNRGEVASGGGKPRVQALLI